MNPLVPQHTCAACGEFLPHACAPVVLISRKRFGRKEVRIIDRESRPGGVPMTPQEAIERAVDMHQRGRCDAEQETAQRGGQASREADAAAAALEDRRWGHGGRAHVTDPRPAASPRTGQAPGAASDRGAAGRNAETELEASA